jgi:hypothetical protein
MFGEILEVITAGDIQSNQLGKNFDLMRLSMINQLEKSFT